MNLKRIFDGECANIEKGRISKNIGEGIAEYYDSGEFLDKDVHGIVSTLREEKEKEKKKIKKLLR